MAFGMGAFLSRYDGVCMTLHCMVCVAWCGAFGMMYGWVGYSVVWCRCLLVWGDRCICQLSNILHHFH